MVWLTTRTLLLSGLPRGSHPHQCIISKESISPSFGHTAHLFCRRGGRVVGITAAGLESERQSTDQLPEGALLLPNNRLAMSEKQSVSRCAWLLLRPLDSRPSPSLPPGPCHTASFPSLCSSTRPRRVADVPHLVPAGGAARPKRTAPIDRCCKNREG